ncbi:unnamed protein product [Vitrella brassicaformis CCMP3155]|uniref:Uncharacterized protein n=1 Tax=Vitrella brassicaformis (strain CCMP3155) TaxID=1169540 RepID=A0A0G4GBX6_VITBC|nr:unnamed protein product [Vitrella brassicaformis CCMP3155]|eukprot:CEM26604.1 unnamed protein product [Vitrella brassicaformis CCMP3155]
MSDGADGGKRQRVDGPAASGHGMSGVSSSQHQQMDAAHNASAAGGSLSFEELQRRFSVLLAQVTQVECDVTTIEGSFVANVAARLPSDASHWYTLKSSISAASEALTAITRGMAATHPPQAPPSHPHPSPPAAHAAPTHTEHTGGAAATSTLPPDVCRDVIYRCLPIDEAVCSARPISRAHGSQLVNEAFALRRVDKHLTDTNLTGLIDVHRPTLQYYTKCAYALEHGGAVWCEWPDFIRLADIYKLTDGLPLIMSSQWMAAHLPTKADFHTMPLALRQYSTFGHLLNYEGTSLALTKVDEADDSDGEDGDEAKKEDGGGRGTKRGRGTHRFRETYDPHNPPVRHDGSLFPSFTAFMKWLVLAEWYGQEGADEKRIFGRRVGDGDERYQRLLTEPIDGHTTIDYTDGRERHIILKGMKEGDTVAAHLYLTDGDINLYTTEAAIKGHTRLAGRYPIAMSLVDLFRVLAETVK